MLRSVAIANIVHPLTCHRKILGRSACYCKLATKRKLSWVDAILFYTINVLSTLFIKTISTRMQPSGFEPLSFWLGITSDTTVHIAVSCFARKIIISPSVWRHSVGNHEKTNARFNHSILRINIQQVSFRTKSMMLYNFVNHFFSLSCFVFEIGMLTPQFSTRWRRRWFHSIAHSYFTIPRHHFYEYSSSRSEVKRVARDFSGHTVYLYAYIRTHTHIHTHTHIYIYIYIQCIYIWTTHPADVYKELFLNCC